MRRARDKKGQSTVEYVIVFTAIAAAIIFAATSIIKPAVNDIYSNAGESMKKGGTYFSDNLGFNKLGP